MKQIGFKNFRKFEDFPNMDLAPITIFVGENNAGKSTVVKGILALSDFLNETNKNSFRFVPIEEILEGKTSIPKRNLALLKEIKFYFNTSYLAHIGTFKRALNNKAKEDAITFYTDLEAFRITVVVRGNRNNDEAVSGNVSVFKINIVRYNIDMIIDIDSDEATLVFNPNPIIDIKSQPKSNILETYFDEVKEKVTYHAKVSEHWVPYSNMLIDSFISMFEMLINSTLVNASNNDNFLSVYNWGEEHLFDDLSKEKTDFFLKIVDIMSPNSITANSMITKFSFSDRKKRNNPKMADIEYLYAHAVTQTVIYSSKDTNDYLSQTIHEFAPHQKTKNKRRFVLKWMKEFGIGNDFVIKSVGGEAHIVYITNSDGEKVNLADKGMGSIQLMVLLFRFAISLPIEGEDSSSDKVIIIEEPEQNLHPMLQSKLADLFFELSNIFNYKFIIETHSEYLVRKTQVIVSEKYNSDVKLKDNPFKVYYFPAAGVPYEVKYRPNGRFENEFGKGFFDEASNLTFKLF